ncbi:MAG: DUF4352 domain-containing protein [Bacilli bacterium]
MILRKPYAFLIKHFRIIHLILLIPICFLTYKSANIYDFFNKMIQSNYVTNQVNIAGTYINIYVYLAIIIIVGSSIAIYYLMKEKNKPTFFYIFLIVYYSILFIWMSLTYNQLFMLENNDAIAATVRTFRDFSQIIYIIQYLFIFFTLFRGIGFDLKSFNFSKDLEELELDEEDNAEIEINFGKNSYKYKRGFRKFLRELRYYILENKFVFGCIVAFIFIIIGSVIYTNVEVYNKKFSLNQPFAMGGLTITVKDSILTNLNYDGSIIAKDKYYLALKIQLTNRSNKAIKLDTTNFRLYLDKKNIYPTIDKTGRFIDYGDNYYGGELKPQSTGDYIFVYELTEDQYRKNYTIRILDSIVYGVGELHPKYRIVTLNPEIQTEVKDIGKVTMDKTINLQDTTIGDATLKINNIEFSKNFYYQYEKCVNKKCNTFNGSITTSQNAYLIVDANIDMDESTFYARNSKIANDFFSDFATLKYTYGGNEYVEKLKNITPSKYEGNLRVYQLPKSVLNATNLEMIITIRNKKATIELIK